MSDTPETDEQRITDLNVAMRLDASGHWTGDTNVEVVSAEFARGLERERNAARELARELYWAGYELRRFARAYANDYDEADGKPGAIQADYAFCEASINLAKVLGEHEEAAK